MQWESPKEYRMGIDIGISVALGLTCAFLLGVIGLIQFGIAGGILGAASPLAIAYWNIKRILS